MWDEPVHVEAPCVQVAVEDKDSVAQRGADLEHARVMDFCGGREPAGTCGAAKRMVSSEAVHRHGTIGRGIPRQDHEHVGDHAAGGGDDNMAREKDYRTPEW